MPIKFRAYPIIADAIERGIDFGVRRAFKHTDTPTPDAIIEHVETEVLNALSEIIDFDAGEVKL